MPIYLSTWKHSKSLVSSYQYIANNLRWVVNQNYLLSPSLRSFDLAGGQWPQALPVVVTAQDSMGSPCQGCPLHWHPACSTFIIIKTLWVATTHFILQFTTGFIYKNTSFSWFEQVMTDFSFYVVWTSLDQFFAVWSSFFWSLP